MADLTDNERKAIVNMDLFGSTGLYPLEDGDLDNIQDLRHLAGLFPFEEALAEATLSGIALDGDLQILFDPILGGQLTVLNGDFVRDTGLRTAVLISLLTDRIALLTDVLPDNTGQRRGWWANPELGSRLWLLFRSSLTTDVPSKIEAFTLESLQWMIDEGVAQQVIVNAEVSAAFQISWVIQIIKPGNKDNSNFKFFFNWETEIFGEVP